MYTVYKFQETGAWLAMAVHADDARQVAHMERIGAQVITKTEYDFGPEVGHVAPHNTEIDQDGNMIRFVAPYAYMFEGQRVDVHTLAQHDARPDGATIVDPLEDIKDHKKAELQAEKVRVRDGGVMVGGVLFDTDQNARLAYQEFFMMWTLNPAYTVEKWKASPGAWVVMDGAKYQEVMQAGAQQMQAVYSWQEQQETTLKSATTAEAVVQVGTVYNA
jgi:hypothetical protein